MVYDIQFYIFLTNNDNNDNNGNNDDNKKL